ncbi:unnamed protein product [Calypogeia fissa]
MALTLAFGPDSALHSNLASVSYPAGGSGGGVSGRFSGAVDSVGCNDVSCSVTLPQRRRLGRKGKEAKCPARRVDGLMDLSFPSSSSRQFINSPRPSCASRRVHCSAEAKTLRTVEVSDGDVEQKSVFQPPLGWPFSAVGTTDFNLLGKRVKGTVTLTDPAVILEEEEEEEEEKAGVSNVNDGSDEGPSKNLYRHWIKTEFSAAVQSGSPPPRQKQENSERDNYYVNTGYAIRTLREELPNMFYKKLNFDIYRDDITFRDPMNVFSGIDNYKLIFWALRFHGRIFFKALWVDIARVWQPHDKVIMVRWTVRGVPRVPWEAQGQFEGTSEYKLDKDGKIYEHKVDNVIFNSPPTQKYKAISLADLVRVDGAHTTPTPSFYAQALKLFAIMFPYLQQFTWVRFYWALTSTLALNNAGETCSELGLNA